MVEMSRRRFQVTPSVQRAKAKQTVLATEAETEIRKTTVEPECQRMEVKLGGRRSLTEQKG